MKSSDFIIRYLVKPNIAPGSTPNPVSMEKQAKENLTGSLSIDDAATSTSTACLPVFLTPEDEFLSTASVVRFTVFVQEQKCTPEGECDDMDSKSTHITILDPKSYRALATCRVFPYSNDTWKLGRLAVLKACRGMHFGIKLMEEAENYVLQETEASMIALHAQKDKSGFYAKMGYVHDESAGEWVEEEMLHIKMIKNIRKK